MSLSLFHFHPVWCVILFREAYDNLGKLKEYKAYDAAGNLTSGFKYNN